MISDFVLRVIKRLTGYAITITLYMDVRSPPQVETWLSPGSLALLVVLSRRRECLSDAIKSAAAPETGEDFQLIADDYQKLILPGMIHVRARPCLISKRSIDRSHSLATSVILCLFPDGMYIRRNAG